MPKTLLLASELTAALPKLTGFLSGRGQKLLFIPTAATGEGWSPEHITHILPFENMGFEVVTHDLSKSREPLPEGLSIGDFHAVYVCGGNTFFLMSHMRRTGFDEIVRKAVDGGLIYIGSSAGSVAATPDIGYAASLDDRAQGDGDDAGLGFVGFAILPHLGHPTMGEAVMNCYSRWDDEEYGAPAFALTDDQVILIEGKRMRVL
jgi:dipeptidase E